MTRHPKQPSRAGGAVPPPPPPVVSSPFLTRRRWAVGLAVAGAAAAAGLLLRGKPPSLGEAVWLAGFVASAAIRLPHASRNRANRVEDRRMPPSERVLWALASVFGTGLPLLYVATGWPGAADYALPPAALALGLALQLAGLWLYRGAHASLGRNWSPGLELREGHTLVVDGVHARIRHPMYAAILLGVLARPLLLQNWVVGLPGLLLYALLIPGRLRHEEAMMAERFGADWAAYAARTGALLPLPRRA